MAEKNLYKNIPETPGVYLMKNAQGEIMYVGKAGNLRRRVSSYFLRPQEARIQKMVSEIKSIETRGTDTAIEALILEASLIKKIQPRYNVREKDDTSFLYVEITKEKFPRVMLVRGKEKANGRRFGPFTSSMSIREALRILRRIFPWSAHLPGAKYERPCFEYEIGLCPGTCAGAVTHAEYKKNISKLKLFFEGKKEKILRDLDREMKAAAKKLDFEKAEELKRRIFALRHIQDVSLITDEKMSAITEGQGMQTRIEGYDISNISGDSAVGSMVVFTGNQPDKNEYRKFKIKYSSEPNPARRSSRFTSGGGDTGMMKEVLRRRLNNDWKLPNLILVDGGAGQVSAAKEVLGEFSLQIPVVGIAKGPERKRNDIIGFVPKGIPKEVLIQVRDEAHRFAITYHKKVRNAKFIGNG